MGPVLQLGDAIVDLGAREVVRHGEVLRLTTLETELLRYLWERSERPVSRDELLSEVWRYRPGIVTRAVDQAVLRLRRKLAASSELHLRPVYGEGYLLTGVSEALDRASAATDSNPFFGRGVELGALRDPAGGFVTVVGPPGAGKSRLVRQHALTCPGAVGWVDCAEATDVDGLVSAIARALRTGGTVAAVGAAVRGLALLVLDDVDRAGPGIADPIRHLAPLARVMVTARAALHTDGERIVEVGALPEDEALRLLVDRAGRAGATIDPDGPAVSRLLELLDRLPLAIELAAGRLGSRSTHELAELLTRAPLGPALDRAMRTSWDLLSPDEQSVLVQATVFRGAFDVEAADGVIGDPAAAEVLEALADRSLLRIRPEDGDFELYESVRSFAVRQGEPAQLAAAGQRHAAHYVAFGGRMRALDLRGDELALDHAAREASHLHAAWAFTRDHDPVLAARAAAVLGWIALARGPLHGLDALLTESLAADVPDDVACELAFVRGGVRVLARSVGAARADLERAGRAADPALRAQALLKLATIARALGELDRAEALLERAVAAAETSGLAFVLPPIFVVLGLVRGQRGDLDGEHRDFERAATLARSLDHPRMESFACRSLGRRAYKLARLDEADAWFQRAVHGVRDIELPLLLAYLAGVALARDRFADALALGRRAVRLVEGLGSLPLVPLVSLAEVLLVTGSLGEAESLYGQALDSSVNLGVPTIVSEVRANLGRVAQARGDRARAGVLYAEAATVGIEDEALVRLTQHQADLAWEEGDLAAAVAAYGVSVEAHRRGGWILGVAGVQARLACVASELGDRALAVATLADLPADVVPGEQALVGVARALVAGQTDPLRAVRDRSGQLLPEFLTARLHR